MLQQRVTVLLRNWCSWRHFELLLAFADCVSGLYFTGAGSATLLSGFPSAGVCLLFWGASGFIASKGLFNADMRGSTFPLLVCTAIDLTASIWIFFWHPSAKKTFWRWMRDSDRPWVLGVFVPLPPLQYADLFGNAVGALGLANLVMFVRNSTCTMKQASKQKSWSRFCIRTVGKLAGQLIAFGIVCFATVGLHNGYVLMDDTNTMPMVRLVSKTTQLKLPTCLRSLGLWTSQEVSLQIHEDTFVPHMVMRRLLPAYKFHPLTFDLEAQSPKLVVFSRMEELLPGLPKYVLLAYCEDFTLVPAWGAHHRYACGAPRLQSAVEMKTFVPGLTLIGADPLKSFWPRRISKARGGQLPTHAAIMGGEFTIRTRKFKQNPLLGRKQFILDIIHPGMSNVSKKDLAVKLSSMYKVKDSQCVMLFGFKTAFGGGRSSGFGLIYDSIERMKKFEPTYRLKRAGLSDAKAGVGRRGKKDTKNRMKKTLGKEKSKARAAGGKK